METAIKEVRLPQTIVPLNYKLHFTEIAPEKSRFAGNVSIELEVKEITNFIMLNAKELAITNVKLVQNEKNIDIVETRMFKKDDRVAFILDSELNQGKAYLTVEFIGILNDYMEGFYRSSYFYNGEKRYMATTQFESTSARMAFPCWDEPAIKATFDVIIDTPMDRIAISNMNVIAKKTYLDATTPYTSYVFDTTLPMSTYLLAFIIGEFDCISAYTNENVQINTYTPVGRTAEGKYALEIGVKALEFYSSFFSIPFPLRKLDLIPICDFAAGAMENWGAITFREVDLLIDTKNASQMNLERVGLVVCHEIAHMWFGDLVTMTWWTYLWLNEGFASFMEYLCLDSIKPEWKLFDTFTSDNNFCALAEDAVVSTHPIEVTVNRPEEVDQIFDSISYSKGATVIRMLYEYIGKESFREGMKLYLSSFKYKNTTTEDLWENLSKASSINTQNLMNNWIKTPGYPMITIHDDLTFDQNRYFINPEDSDKDAKWNIPLIIKTPSWEKKCIYYADQSNDEFTAILEQTKTEKWYKINYNMTSMVRVLYPESNYIALCEAVKNNEINVKDCFNILNDINSFISSQRLQPSAALNYLKYFSNCPSEVVCIVAGILNNIYKIIKDQSYVNEFKSMAASILKPCYEKLYFSEILEKPDNEILGNWVNDNKSRPTITSVYLALSDDKNMYNGIVKQVDAYIKDSESHPISPEMRQTMYTIYIKGQESDQEMERRFNNILNIYKNAIAVAEKKRALLSLGYTPSKKLLNTYFNMVLTEEIRRQDSYVVFAVGARNEHFNTYPWTFFADHWEQLNDMLRTSFGLLSGIIEYSIDGIEDESMIEVIKKFFDERPSILGVDMTVKKSLEQIHTYAIKKSFYIKSFGEYFNTH